MTTQVTRVEYDSREGEVTLTVRRGFGIWPGPDRADLPTDFAEAIATWLGEDAPEPAMMAATTAAAALDRFEFTEPKWLSLRRSLLRMCRRERV